MTINEIKSQCYTNSRTENITEMYNYNESVFLCLTIQKSDMKLIDNLSKHIFLDYIQFDFQFKKAENKIFIIKAKNLIIFRSEINKKNIDIMREMLRKNNKLDYEKKNFIKFIRTFIIMIIFKFKVNFFLHQIIMKLLFFSQV